MSLVLGVLAALLPRRYWLGVERASGVAPRPTLSAVLSILIGLCVGAPAFIRHVAQGSSDASSMTLRIAGEQLRHAAEHEVTSATTQTLTMMSILTFVATPLGFACAYLLVSGALRAACVYFDDAMGDPALTAADAVVRRGAHVSRRARNRITQRLTFGTRVADRVIDGASVGDPGVDVAVLSSRPKDGWTVGTMVISTRDCYRIVGIAERRFEARVWIAYLLARKTDAEILRRSVRYAI